MKKPILYLCILFSQLLSAQSKSILISGRVIDRDEPEKRIYAIKVRLSFNDSLFLESDCDSLGYYKFQISAKFLRSYKICLSVYQDQDKLKKMFPKIGPCARYQKGPDRYFDVRKMELVMNKDSITSLNYNISVNKMISCGFGPCISFKKNSLEFLPCDGENADTIIGCYLSSLLLDNPTIVIEICGFSWEESTMKKLSFRRTEMIKNRLLAYGIDKERILTKDCGDKFPIISKNQIRKASKNEKEILKTQNRRVSFKILSFDYDSKAKKIKDSGD